MTHNLQEKIADTKLREILVENGQNDLHPKDKTRPHENEGAKSWQTNKITYMLGAEQNHKKVSKGMCSQETKSHTV